MRIAARGMKWAIAGLLVAGPGLAARGGALTAYNTTLVSNVPLATATDISAEGDLVFVGRMFDGVSILDVSIPDTPVVLTTWDHPTQQIRVQDVRPLGTTLWLSQEHAPTPFGLVGLDISVPAVPQLITTLGSPTFPSLVHNLWSDPDDDILYLSGYGSARGNFIVDVSDPANPQLLANIQTDIHDVNEVGDVLYIAGGYEGTYVYDVSTPGTPVAITSFTPNTPDSSFYQHNAYPIGTTGYVLVTEELQIDVNARTFVQGSVRVWDTRDPQNPVEVWRWRSEHAKSNSFITPHNVYAVGNFAYLSAYQDGLKIFDVSTPTDPVEVAYYDTYPDVPTAAFQGAWGVHALDGPDRLFVSDRTYGFFHVTFNGARRAVLEGTVRDDRTLLPIAGAEIHSVTADRTVVSDKSGRFEIKTGSGMHIWDVSATNYDNHVDSVFLTGLQTTHHDFLVTSNVVSVDPEPTPAALALGPARPNPFRTETSLALELWDTRSPVEIAVFDARGARVRTLIADGSAGGAGDVTWDGRTDAGARAASGVYYVRLRAGNEIRTRAVTLSR